MIRRRLISILALPMAVGPAAVLGQTRTAAVIGRLHPGPAPDSRLQHYLGGFQAGMLALGHAEGKSYRVEARFAGGDAARLSALASELVRQKVDLIIAHGSVAVRAAKEATASIPIVMAMSGPDPVGTGLIAALARPGGNVTGLTGQTDELPRKQLELLRGVLPRLTDVLVIHNPASVIQPDASLREVATGLGLRLRPVAVGRLDELEAAFARAAPAAGQAVIALTDPAVIDRLAAPIAALAMKHRLASAQSFRAGVEAGSLLGFGIDLFDMHRRSASFVDKILKGMSPSEIPVEQPVKFEMLVNLRTARALGIDIPAPLLLRADEVIE